MTEDDAIENLGDEKDVNHDNNYTIEKGDKPNIEEKEAIASTVVPMLNFNTSKETTNSGNQVISTFPIEQKSAVSGKKEEVDERGSGL